METPTLEHTPKMLQTLIGRFGILEERISKLSSPNYKPIEPPINLKDGAKFLGVSDAFMYKGVQSGNLPHYKKGGKLYFLKSELLEWVKSGRIKSNIQLSEDLDNTLNK